MSLRARLTLRYLLVFASVAIGIVGIGWAILRPDDRQALVLVVTATTLAAVGAGWLLASRLMSPISELSEAVAQVSPERIEMPSEMLPDSQQPADELDHLRQALDDAMTRLAEGYDAQDRFIANVAHDLKTPIAVMLAESQILAGREPTLDAFESYRRSVEEEMQHLGRLIEGFLTLARADRGIASPREEWLPANDLVIECISRCHREAELHEVHIVPTLELRDDDANEVGLVGDPDLLVTMINNIVRNAVNFSPSGATVDVSVKHAGANAIICIRDRGPGLPDGDIERLFDRFARADQPDNSRVKGTGLGLAIARSVAELHGGTIGARNHNDGGCVFTVRLPAVPRVA